MSKSRRILAGLAVATSLFAVACSDASRSATAPDIAVSTATESANLGIVDGLLGLLVAPVKRNAPLANDVSWTFRAGPNGGYTSNSALGVTVNVPAGALDENVVITVTALKGAPIAYSFSPHLEFGKKVYITQSLKGTSAGLLASLLLNGAHFPGDRPEYTGSGLAIVDEVVPALLNGLLGTLNRSATFGVTHFSGWLLGSGAQGSME
ncbi:MAG: hypothetical protein ACRENU_16225 [Gemmatimonadaceae bacterium]